MDLAEHLRQNDCHIVEGYVREVPEQASDLIRYVAPVTRIMEIGFNAGHSSDLFLSANPSARVVSFDIGTHDYVTAAKRFIDANYPGRHTLILGDSRTTVPTYASEHPNETFDVIFIDGGHDYDTALADLKNCQKLAHKDTTVILDDTVFEPYLQMFWNVGPVAAWTQMLNTGAVTEIERKQYFGMGRGQVVGKYVF